MQITEFDIITPQDIDTVSSILDVKFYRDTENVSGLFTGSDPVAAASTVKEFDIHYQMNQMGSLQKYIKY